MRTAIFMSIFASYLAFVSAAPHTSTKRDITCPSTNKDGIPLLGQGTVEQLHGGISCTYEGDFCAYFANGRFSSGSDACPISISGEGDNTKSDSDSENPGNPGNPGHTGHPGNPGDSKYKKPETPGSTCLPVDNDGSTLIQQGKTENLPNGITCRYDGQFCIYFANGSFSSGSSVCPVSLSPGGSRPKPFTPPNGRKICAEEDNEGNTLAVERDTNAPVDGVSCEYMQGPFCTYFKNGAFSSGSIACPRELVNA